jgi:hypothetical protein
MMNPEENLPQRGLLSNDETGNKILIDAALGKAYLFTLNYGVEFPFHGPVGVYLAESLRQTDNDRSGYWYQYISSKLIFHISENFLNLVVDDKSGQLTKYQFNENQAKYLDALIRDYKEDGEGIDKNDVKITSIANEERKKISSIFEGNKDFYKKYVRRNNNKLKLYSLNKYKFEFETLLQN